LLLRHHPCPFGGELPGKGQPATFQRRARAGSILPERFGDSSAICCFIALAPSVLILQKSQDSNSSQLLLGCKFYDHSTVEFHWRQEDEYLRLYDKGDIYINVRLPKKPIW